MEIMNVHFIFFLMLIMLSGCLTSIERDENLKIGDNYFQISIEKFSGIYSFTYKGRNMLTQTKKTVKAINHKNIDFHAIRIKNKMEIRLDEAGGGLVQTVLNHNIRKYGSIKDYKSAKILEIIGSKIKKDKWEFINIIAFSKLDPINLSNILSANNYINNKTPRYTYSERDFNSFNSKDVDKCIQKRNTKLEERIKKYHKKNSPKLSEEKLKQYRKKQMFQNWFKCL